MPEKSSIELEVNFIGDMKYTTLDYCLWIDHSHNFDNI